MIEFCPRRLGMTLEQLRIFVTVAEYEHMTRAAGSLNLTQSATSAAIHALETRYRCRFFDRIGRRIALTDTGRDFLPEAREVLARAFAAEGVLDDIAGLRRGFLRIVATQSIANYWLPSRLSAFRKQYPSLDLHLSIATTKGVQGFVRDGSADLGFADDVVVDTPLMADRIAAMGVIVVSPLDHPWSRSPPDLLRAAEAECWIMREPGTQDRRDRDDALRTFGLMPHRLSVVLELPSEEAVLSAVEAGAGVAAVTGIAAASGMWSNAVSRISTLASPGAITMIRNTRRAKTDATAGFIHLIRSGSRPGDGQGAP
jgi:DNA-binding transcriptional LysR family regulator